MPRQTIPVIRPTKKAKPLYTVVYSDGSKSTVEAYNLIWAWKKAELHAKAHNISAVQVDPAGEDNG
jgi:hypothetical protein